MSKQKLKEIIRAVVQRHKALPSPDRADASVLVDMLTEELFSRLKR